MGPALSCGQDGDAEIGHRARGGDRGPRASPSAWRAGGERLRRGGVVAEVDVLDRGGLGGGVVAELPVAAAPWASP